MSHIIIHPPITLPVITVLQESSLKVFFVPVLLKHILGVCFPVEKLGKPGIGLVFWYWETQDSDLRRLRRIEQSIAASVNISILSVLEPVEGHVIIWTQFRTVFLILAALGLVLENRGLCSSYCLTQSFP